MSAKDKASGKEQSIKIEASSGLSEADIEKMKKDAETHADEDKKKKESIEKKNIAEQLIYTAEKTLKDGEGKIKDDTKSEVEEKIKNLREKLDSGNPDEISKLTEELSASLQKAGGEMTQQSTETAKGEGKKKENL